MEMFQSTLMIKGKKKKFLKMKHEKKIIKNINQLHTNNVGNSILHSSDNSIRS